MCKMQGPADWVASELEQGGTAHRSSSLPLGGLSPSSRLSLDLRQAIILRASTLWILARTMLANVGIN